MPQTAFSIYFQDTFEVVTNSVPAFIKKLLSWITIPVMGRPTQWRVGRVRRRRGRLKQKQRWRMGVNGEWCDREEYELVIMNYSSLRSNSITLTPLSKNYLFHKPSNLYNGERRSMRSHTEKLQWSWNPRLKGIIRVCKLWQVHQTSK